MTSANKCVKTSTIIQDALDLIKERTGKDIDINRIPLNDKETFELLSRGETDAVFQLESGGMKKVLMDLNVSSFEDISSCLALYRPGPMDMIPHFIARKFNREVVKYPHKDLEEILKETYGVIVYQEQIMLIARKFAGYS